MTITETNKLWLQRTADHFQATPEAVLDGILNLLRQRDQNQGQGQKFTDWIEAAGQAHVMTSEQLVCLKRAINESEAAAKATQVYLSIIQTNKTQRP